MKVLTPVEWKERQRAHRALVSPMADAFLHRRGLQQKHPVYDFLFTYYPFSPTKLKQWVPSFEEALIVDENEIDQFSSYWFEVREGVLRLNQERLGGQALACVTFVEKLCRAVLERTQRFGCFGLHEWAMVYRLSPEELRHRGCRLRLSPEALATFVESQNLCCTHYDAYRFFTPQSEPLNLFKPTLETRIEYEQGGCLHANMDLYKWSTKLWPWIGSDFIAKTFLLAVAGRELDMRASPYDLESAGYAPICIETEAGRREYQHYQLCYAKQAIELRRELAAFCARFKRLHSIPEGIGFHASIG